jgi:hypothetical protein
MPTRSFRPSRRGKRRDPQEVDALVAEAAEAARARSQGYRERSLALHGWICGKCAREFDRANLNLLTVHHKDGNHQNNCREGRKRPRGVRQGHKGIPRLLAAVEARERSLRLEGTKNVAYTARD